MARGGRRAWLVWSIAAAAYVLAFFQRLAPPVVLDRLMDDFGVGASQVGLLTAAYFYGYMLMQLPAGVVVDRWGARVAVVASLLVSGAGTLVFAWAPGLAVAAAARLAVALGDALVFSSLIKIAARWFAPQRFGLMSALSQASGFVGGLLATSPFAVAVTWLGWRRSFLGVAVAVGVVLVLSLAWLHDAPDGAAARGSVGAAFAGAFRALRAPTTWGSLLTYTSSYVLFMSLSAVWGVALLMQAYGWSREA
ncbi:MAG TPA: MFS transporter, partial [Methylomirabilota bacterium]|nr:MFS transporter [Methylomirabilota bacterium]